MDSPDGVLRLLGFPPLKLSPHLEGVARMIRPGLSVLLERRLPELRSLRLGLVAHQAPVTPNLHLAVEALREADCRLVRLFSLEHGLWSAAPDGILVSSDWDSHLERPVVSLYRERRRTEEESPEGFFND